jgi:D-serine deaminase-like pyridoxal phosphate-dependent protein
MRTPLRDLDTPCLLLERPLFLSNLRAMQDSVARAGKRLRPHAKTHKCSRVSRAQLDAGAVGVCAAKLSEAEALLAAGVEPVLVTGPVVTQAKLERVAALRSAGRRLSLAVDSEEAARRLESACARAGAVAEVLIDVDPRLGRTGVSVARAPSLADFIGTCRHLRLAGLQMYAGNVQHLQDHAERRARSLELMGEGAELFRELRRRGFAMTVFTGGGTGTFDIDTGVPELTDLQVGSYAVMDVQYLGLGSREDPAAFGHFRPALRVLSTVLSANARGHVTVDAGLKTLYRDTPAPAVAAPAGGAYAYDWYGDEYGKVSVPSGAPALAVGDLVEIVPSHCDPTINLFDRLHVVEDGAVVEVWPIDLRGKSQ